MVGDSLRSYPRRMARKPDPERIYLARRAAHFGRLGQYGRFDELDAEHWLSAWEREAERRGLDRQAATFWREGEAWQEAVIKAYPRRIV